MKQPRDHALDQILERSPGVVRTAAEVQEVSAALDSLESFLEGLGDREPEEEELEEWAKRPPK